MGFPTIAVTFNVPVNNLDKVPQAMKLLGALQDDGPVVPPIKSTEPQDAKPAEKAIKPVNKAAPAGKPMNITAFKQIVSATNKEHGRAFVSSLLKHYSGKDDKQGVMLAALTEDQYMEVAKALQAGPEGGITHDEDAGPTHKEINQKMVDVKTQLAKRLKESGLDPNDAREMVLDHVSKLNVKGSQDISKMSPKQLAKMEELLNTEIPLPVQDDVTDELDDGFDDMDDANDFDLDF